jgi:predicted PurR-regulated permease PerM
VRPASGKFKAGRAKLPHDLTRLTLAVLFIAGLIVTCLWIVHPFLPAVIWGATLVIATWPIMRRLQARLWNSRGLATTVMTLALLLVIVVPFWLAIGTIVTNSGQILQWAESLASMSLPPPPSWVAEIPLVGPGISHAWENIGDTGRRELLQKARPAHQWVSGPWAYPRMGGPARGGPVGSVAN